MKSTLCHSISKKTFCTIWWRLHDKNETIFTIRCRQGSFVTNISFKCVWYISIGHSVSIKASVWLRHSIHSSISHFPQGEIGMGRNIMLLSCLHVSYVSYFFCKYWLSCLSFDFSYIYIMWFLWGLAWPCVTLPYVILIKTVF